MPTLQDLYQLVDHADVSVDVRITGVLITQMESCSWSFAIGKVPTATVRLAGPTPGVVAFFADVRIDAGFNGITTRVFTGKVMHVNPDELGTTIECQGMAFALDDPYHKVVSTLANITAQQAVTDLLIAALVPNYVVNMPAWTIGTVVVQTLTFQTYGEAINKISEVDGARWMEFPSGQIRVQPLDPVPSLTAWRKYFGMVLTGLTEAYPANTSAADGRPRLRRMHGEQQIRLVKNRCFVRGAVVDQTNADGTVSPIDIEDDAQASSPWVLNPDGSQAYNDELFSNELIDQVTKAGTVAARIVTVKNRLNTKGAAVIDGDPELALGRTVYIGDPDYSGIEANFFVESYTTSWTQDDFSSSLTLIGGENAGGSVNISPFALFTYVAEREVVKDAEYAILTLDGRGAIDPDGTIASRSWSSNQVPEIVSGTDEVITILVDLAVLTTPFVVTYTVVDNLGATDSISLTVTLDTGATDVFKPAYYVAGDIFFSASPDAGTTWNDQAVPGGDSCASVGAKPGDGSSAGVGMYGTTGAKVYRTTDFCATAPALVFTGLGEIVAFGNSFWQTGLCWAASKLGILYRSDDDGLTWRFWDDLRLVFGKPNFRADIILTPREGGVWVIGGDGEGRPVMAFDPVLTHAWGQVALGGELLIDLLTNPIAPDLYIRGWATGDADHSNAVILLNSATYPTAMYWTNDVLGDGSAWKRAVGLPAKTQGRWLTGEYGAGSNTQFQFGFNDNVVYLGDITAGVLNITAAAGAMAAGDVPNRAVAIGGILGGIAGAHIVAAEGAVDGTLYKTWDRFTTNPVAMLRPASGFGVPPAGWNGKMVTLSSAGGAATVATVRLLVSYATGVGGERHRIGTTWQGDDIAALPGALPYILPFALESAIWYLCPLSANTDTNPGLDMLRTPDAGTTWAASLARAIAFAIGPDGNHYAATFDDNTAGRKTQLQKSTDHGVSFSVVSTFTPGSGVFRGFHIAIHPTDANFIVIFGRTGPSDVSMIVTKDGGATWTQRTPWGLQFEQNPNNDVVILQNGRIVVMRMSSSTTMVISTSDDDGASWTDRYTQTGASAGALLGQGIAAVPPSKVVVLRGDTNGTPDEYDLLVSDDGATSFVATGPTAPMISNNTPVWHSLVLDPSGLAAYIASNHNTTDTHYVVRLTPIADTSAWEDMSTGIVPFGVQVGIDIPEDGLAWIPA